MGIARILRDQHRADGVDEVVGGLALHDGGVPRESENDLVGYRCVSGGGGVCGSSAGVGCVCV